MRMGNVPVAISLQVAYFMLPNMIYDKKKGGGRNLVTSPFALLHFYIAREEFRGIGLTQQLHTSGLAIYSSFFF